VLLPLLKLFQAAFWAFIPSVVPHTIATAVGLSNGIGSPDDGIGPRLRIGPDDICAKTCQPVPGREAGATTRSVKIVGIEIDVDAAHALHLLRSH